jgi:hypothetical protein
MAGDFDAITIGSGLGGLGTSRGVETSVPGLWLASTFGGFGGFSGAMLSAMLAARAAVKSQFDSHAAQLSTTDR